MDPHAFAALSAMSTESIANAQDVLACKLKLLRLHRDLHKVPRAPQTLGRLVRPALHPRLITELRNPFLTQVSASVFASVQAETELEVAKYNHQQTLVEVRSHGSRLSYGSQSPPSYFSSGFCSTPQLSGE